VYRNQKKLEDVKHVTIVCGNLEITQLYQTTEQKVVGAIDRQVDSAEFLCWALSKMYMPQPIVTGYQYLTP
jgi:hypothetical protein